MKTLNKNSFVKKLIFALIIILLICAAVPNTISYAADAEESFGGKLLKPIVDLLLSIGDIAMNFIHNIIYGSYDPIIKVDLDTTLIEYIVIILGAIIAIAVAALLIFGAAAISGAVIAKVATIVAAKEITVASVLTPKVIGMIVVAAIPLTAKTGIVAGAYIHSEWFGDEAVLTQYKITPEEIFSGEVDLLRANFFSSDAEETRIDTVSVFNLEINPATNQKSRDTCYKCIK